MSDVVSFPPPPPPRAPSLKDKLGHHDAFCLKLCAEWRVARAQMQKDLAEHSLATGWGTLPDKSVELDQSPLDQIEDLENLLAQAKPRTALLARELLTVALAILASEHEDLDLENRLAMAPAIEILRNVAAALEHCEPGMRIGP